MKAKVAVAIALGLAALAVLGSGLWLLRASDREARQLAFANEGSGLQATDVQAALLELSRRVQQVEKGQTSLQGAALVQQTQIGAVQSSVEVQKADADARLATLETRLAAAAAPRVRIEYSDGSSSNTVGASYHRLRTLGGFSKLAGGSSLLLTWNTHVDALGEPGTFCDFQLRVDGRPDMEQEGGGGRAVVYVPPGATGGSAPVTVSVLFDRLGSGSHAVDIWVRGTARECMENFGNFPRAVIVEEGPGPGR
jgi:hypothetical protein